MIRVLSDLHWGHKASLIKESDSLQSLVSEADTVIFNGDTLEQIYEDSPSHIGRPLPSIRDLQQKIDSWNTKAVFITGNHDPDISNAHYCELNDGQILITHGDAIFDSIAPWSQHSDILKQSVANGVQQLSKDNQPSFYHYLQIFKNASKEQHALVKDYDPTMWGKFQIFLRQAWPPTRILKVLDSWKKAPSNAVELVERFGFSPEFLIIGHTHKPDISTCGTTTVLNSGSFLPWPGATSIDISESGIEVKEIIRNGSQFIAGKTVHRQAIDIDLESLRIPIDTPKTAAKPAYQFSA